MNQPDAKTNQQLMQAFIDSKLNMTGQQNPANNSAGSQVAQSAVLGGGHRGTEPIRIRAHTDLKDFNKK